MFNVRPNYNESNIDKANNRGQILYVLGQDDDIFVTHAVFTAIPTATQLQNVCNALGMNARDFHTYVGVYEIPVGSLVDSVYPSHYIVNWKVI